jgi:hypothetical protein
MKQYSTQARLAALGGLFMTLPVLSCCATHATLALEGSKVQSDATCPPSASGSLVVYSATYPQTLEQSEYPAHTNYTVATVGDQVIERVANNTGSFGAVPASVQLPCGQYHVRAQYGAGRFVIVPVAIQAGKTTILDLDGEPLPAGGGPAKGPMGQPGGPMGQPVPAGDSLATRSVSGPMGQPIRLPDGQIAGWRATIG